MANKEIWMAQRDSTLDHSGAPHNVYRKFDPLVKDIVYARERLVNDRLQ